MGFRHFAAPLLSIAVLGLAACSEQEAQVEQAPEGVAGLNVSNARLVLPAVSGNPAAVYFDLGYEGDAEITLSAVAVDGAENTMMHQYGEKDLKVQMIPLDPLPLTKGSTVSFEPGGKHVMAMGVSDELTAGGKTEVTLIMASGDKTTVTADIVGAGEDR
jgi:copper(I)-binding protein